MSPSGSRVLAGRMRQRIHIEQPVSTPDTLGGVTRSWEEVAAVWAEIHGISGNERFIAGKLASRVTHRIVLRYREDLTPEMRIVFGARTFAILAIIERENTKHMLEILAEEGDAI